jgi:co-chaperonin GroES (HSP10)
MSISIKGSDGISSRRVKVMGINVLVKNLTDEEKTGSGIIIPQQGEKNDPLCRGKVIDVGPGFLYPDKNEIDDIIKEQNLEPKFIKLDVEKGNTIYYEKGHERSIRLNNEEYFLVYYHDIRLVLIDEINL